MTAFMEFQLGCWRDYRVTPRRLLSWIREMDALRTFPLERALRNACYSGRKVKPQRHYADVAQW